MARFNRISQLNHKRGGILEQRRRPTVKFQSHFALSQVVAMRLTHHLEAPLFDVCSAAETHRLRCGRVAPRAFCRSQLRNPGLILLSKLLPFSFYPIEVKGRLSWDQHETEGKLASLEHGAIQGFFAFRSGRKSPPVADKNC